MQPEASARGTHACPKIDRARNLSRALPAFAPALAQFIFDWISKEHDRLVMEMANAVLRSRAPPPLPQAAAGTQGSPQPFPADPHINFYDEPEGGTIRSVTPPPIPGTSPSDYDRPATVLAITPGAEEPWAGARDGSRRGLPALTVADCVSLRTKQRLLSRYHAAVTAYICVSVCAVLLPVMAGPQLRTAIVGLQNAILFLLLAGLAWIFRLQEESPYVPLADSAEAHAAGAAALGPEVTTELEMLAAARGGRGQGEGAALLGRGARASDAEAVPVERGERAAREHAQAPAGAEAEIVEIVAESR